MCVEMKHSCGSHAHAVDLTARYDEVIAVLRPDRFRQLEKDRFGGFQKMLDGELAMLGLHGGIEMHYDMEMMMMMMMIVDR